MGSGVGEGWGLENLWSTFVLSMLEAEKYDVSNVNNVQCSVTVSISKELSPGEDNWVMCQSHTEGDLGPDHTQTQLANTMYCQH